MFTHITSSTIRTQTLHGLEDLVVIFSETAATGEFVKCSTRPRPVDLQSESPDDINAPSTETATLSSEEEENRTPEPSKKRRRSTSFSSSSTKNSSVKKSVAEGLIYLADKLEKSTRSGTSLVATDCADEATADAEERFDNRDADELYKFIKHVTNTPGAAEMYLKFSDKLKEAMFKDVIS
jgi:hypothetical protein